MLTFTYDTRGTSACTSEKQNRNDYIFTRIFLTDWSENLTRLDDLMFFSFYILENLTCNMKLVWGSTAALMYGICGIEIPVVFPLLKVVWPEYITLIRLMPQRYRNMRSGERMRFWGKLLSYSNLFLTIYLWGILLKVLNICPWHIKYVYINEENLILL